MSDQDGQDEQIEAILQLWESQRNRGITPVIELLCSDCPELIPEIQVLIELAGSVDRAVGALLSPGYDSTSTPVQVEIRTTLDNVLPMARGGFSHVYDARDQFLGRRLALKMLNDDSAVDDDVRRRFDREVTITSRLSHPGIVAVIGKGENEKLNPHYAMHLVNGKTLEETIQEFHDDLRSGTNNVKTDLQCKIFRVLLERFVAICNAIEYAHSQGVIHHDIKPKNIIVGNFGQTVVVDWGLALVVDEARSSAVELPTNGRDDLMAQPGDEVPGTPGYMSPEQLQGELPKFSDDVYALGATLYTLLTGTSPAAVVVSQTAAQKKRRRTASLNNMSSTIPSSLRAVCKRAMSTEFTNRYSSPEALANDIKDCLADRAPSAFPDGPVDALMRWLRHHRSATRVTYLALISMLVLVWWDSGNHQKAEKRLTLLNEKNEGLQAQVESKYRESLETSASILSQSIASQLDSRFLLLREFSRDPDLLRRLEERPDSTQEWLRDKCGDITNRVPSTSWFVVSKDGIQIARFPLVDSNGTRIDSIGKAFRYRDYFHGMGADGPEDGLTYEKAEPHEHPAYLSVTFISKNTDRPMTALSVPIWNNSHQSIGVICTTLETGKLLLNEDALLVDTRGDQMDPSAASHGRIIDNALLPLSDHKLPPTIGNDALSAANDLMSRVTAGRRHSTARILEAFEDPLTGTVHLGALSQVVSHNLEGEPFPTGWVVILKGRSLSRNLASDETP